jgi:hypothetical protein
MRDRAGRRVETCSPEPRACNRAARAASLQRARPYDSRLARVHARGACWPGRAVAARLARDFDLLAPMCELTTRHDLARCEVTAHIFRRTRVGRTRSRGFVAACAQLRRTAAEHGHLSPPKISWAVLDARHGVDRPEGAVVCTPAPVRGRSAVFSPLSESTTVEAAGACLCRQCRAGCLIWTILARVGDNQAAAGGEATRHGLARCGTAALIFRRARAGRTRSRGLEAACAQLPWPAAEHGQQSPPKISWAVLDARQDVERPMAAVVRCLRLRGVDPTCSRRCLSRPRSTARVLVSVGNAARGA